MTDDKRQATIDSWHTRADAYDILIQRYRIFIDMAMGLVNFVQSHRPIDGDDLHVMDLAAGTGLISKLLLEHLQLPPTSLHLVEPAERMCVHARQAIKTPHIHHIAAEDCLSSPDISRHYFDFILCNASMHLMSESVIYPIVSQLLKPTRGYFLYTLWCHSFDETADYTSGEDFETSVNEVLASFGYPKYFSAEDDGQPKTSPPARSRAYLAETARNNGLQLQSCIVRRHRTPASFNLDFALMTPQWLHEHLQSYEWTQKRVDPSIRERIVEKVRAAIEEKFEDIPVVEVVVSRA